MAKQYPNIGDLLAQKKEGRRKLAHLSFDEKLDLLDQLHANVGPLREARGTRENDRARLT